MTLLLLNVSSHRISWGFSSLLVSIQSSQFNAVLAWALSSVVIKHWRWVKVLHMSLHTRHHHLRRPEFSGSPFYFLLIWIWGSKESHSLHHLSRVKDSERTLWASEDSNLEVKKKSPFRSDRLIAAAGLSLGSQHPLVSFLSDHHHDHLLGAMSPP
jgi:hypothetical protein